MTRAEAQAPARPILAAQDRAWSQAGLVLVSDLGMPDIDGYDLIRKVRGGGHRPKDLPAVALTAYARKEDRRHALLAGYQVHLSKPVDPHELLAVIASLSRRTG